MTGPGTPADPAPPPGVDATKPSIARVYDYVLGGKDNYAGRAAVGRDGTQAVTAPMTPAVTATRYEWSAVAVRDGDRVVDARGVCTHQSTAVRQVEAELADVPADADAYGSVRGLTVTSAYANAADGGYQRWGWQAVATRDADGEVAWFRDRDPDGHAD